MAKKLRADIEGLRGLAVTLVVLFHAGVPFIPGGYVGVDVFFVISGFLITGQLMAERRETGRVALATFYARRIRRLLPASVVVLVSTLIASYFLMPPLARLGLARAAQATAAYVSNIWFAFSSTNYLADPTPSPLQHYWSLAVEEQFYLVWPLLLLLVCVGSRRPRRRALVAISALSAVSVLGCVVLTEVSQPWAFFSLPTRAWELGAGAVVALTAHRLARIPAALSVPLGWIGLGAILAAGLLYDEATAFPGVAALLPVLGAAAVITAGVSSPRLGPEMVLRVAPAVQLGRISYSLYLWHWPVLIIPAAAAGHQLSPLDRSALVVVAVGLAVITYRLVENPIRRSRVLVSRQSVNFMMAGALTTAAILASLLVSTLPALDTGKPTPELLASGDLRAATKPAFVPSNLRPSLTGAKDDAPIIYADGCHAGTASTRSATCVYGDTRSNKTVVLFGDSHAAQWFPPLDALAKEHGWRLLSLTKSSCPSVSVTVQIPLLKRAYYECDRWRANSLARIRAAAPFAVVMSNSNVYEPVKVTPGGRDRIWGLGLQRTVEALPAHAHAIVLSDTPHLDQEPATCLSRNLTDPSACSVDRDTAVDVRHQHVEGAAAQSAGATFVDVVPWMCSERRCQAILGNMLVFRDSQHLATPFSTFLANRLDDFLTSGLS